MSEFVNQNLVADLMTHQSISGTKTTPEIFQNNEFSKMCDVHAFAFVVYEILMKEIPFSELTNFNQIFNEVVLKNKRSTIKKEIPASFRYLIEKCWAQDPNERQKLDKIVYNLKNNKKNY